MKKILLIRHGDYLKCDDEDPGLNADGAFQAQSLGAKLRNMERHGGEYDQRHVAASESRRTQETARIAGAQTIDTYDFLGEVPHDLEDEELKRLTELAWIPGVALDAGRVALEELRRIKPNVVYSHGLKIAGITAVARLMAGQPLEGEPLRLEHCGIRELII